MGEGGDGCDEVVRRRGRLAEGIGEVGEGAVKLVKCFR